MIVEQIKKIVLQETKYLRHYYGQVVDVDDDETQGRVKVKVPMLGWIEADSQPWCRSRDRNRMNTPEVDEWVEVYFMDGNRNIPVYVGGINEFKEQIVESYDDPKVKVLYDDKKHFVTKNDTENGEIEGTFDDNLLYRLTEDEILIGESGHMESARKDDEVKSTSAEDSTYWTFWNAFFAVAIGAPINEL